MVPRSRFVIRPLRSLRAPQEGAPAADKLGPSQSWAGRPLPSSESASNRSIPILRQFPTSCRIRTGRHLKKKTPQVQLLKRARFNKRVISRPLPVLRVAARRHYAALSARRRGDACHVGLGAKGERRARAVSGPGKHFLNCQRAPLWQKQEGKTQESARAQPPHPPESPPTVTVTQETK